MKIIYTTEQDFIQQEIAEHGFEYVDQQFDLGYVPCLIQPGGFWAWTQEAAENVHRSIQSNSSTSDIGRSPVPNNRVDLVSHVGA